jgi:hypothetical protein
MSPDEREALTGNEGHYVTALIELFAETGAYQVNKILARRIINEAGYWRQRPLWMPDVLSIATDIDNGDWRPGGPPLVFARLSDEDGVSLVLVDGQHRMHGLAHAKYDDAEIAVGISIVEAAEREDVDAIYTLYDRGRRRSDSDTLNALGKFEAGAIASEEKLQKNVGSVVFRAVRLIACDFKDPRYHENAHLYRSDAARHRLCEPHWSAALAFQLAIREASPKAKAKWLTAGVTAVALLTFEHHPGKAHELWHGLAMNQRFGRTDPKLALLEDDPRSAFLRFCERPKAERDSQFDLAKAAEIMTNAFLRGQRKQNIWFSRKEGPLVIRIWEVPRAARRNGEG